MRRTYQRFDCLHSSKCASSRHCIEPFSLGKQDQSLVRPLPWGSGGATLDGAQAVQGPKYFAMAGHPNEGPLRTSPALEYSLGETPCASEPIPSARCSRKIASFGRSIDATRSSHPRGIGSASFSNGTVSNGTVTETGTVEQPKERKVIEATESIGAPRPELNRRPSV